MSTGVYARDVSDAIRRVVHQTRADISDEARDVLQGALDEISALVEEMELTIDELQLQNEEASAARFAIETELDHLRSLFQSAPFAYLVTTDTGVIHDANDEAAHLFSRPSARLQGKPLAALVPLEERRGFRHYLSSCARGVPMPPVVFALSTRFDEVIRCVVACSKTDDMLLCTFQPAGNMGALAVTGTGRRDVSLVDEITIILHDAGAPEVLLDRLLRRLVPDICDFCLVELVGVGGSSIRCAIDHSDRSKRSILSEILQKQHAPVRRGASLPDDTVTAVNGDVIDALSSSEAECVVMKSLELQSCMRSPLIHEDSTIGSVTFGWLDAGPMPDEVSQVLAMVTRLSGLAFRSIDTQAHTQAAQGSTNALAAFAKQAAIPLDAILSQIDLLDARGISALEGARLPIHSVRDGARHVRSIVGDVMSSVGMEMERRESNLVDVDLTALLQSVALLMGPVADHRNVTITLVLPAEHLSLRTDEVLLRSILTGMLDHAIASAHNDVLTVRNFAEANGVAFVVGTTATWTMPDPDTSVRRDASLESAVAGIGAELTFGDNAGMQHGNARLWVPDMA